MLFTQVRICYDVMEDYYSPRSAASELLGMMCKVRALSLWVYTRPLFLTASFSFYFFYSNILISLFTIFSAETPKNVPAGCSFLLCQRHAGSSQPSNLSFLQFPLVYTVSQKNKLFLYARSSTRLTICVTFSAHCRFKY
jgi:hypothetical protein